MSDFKILASKAQTEADHKNEPFFIVWQKGKHSLVPAKIYRAELHGCVEGVRYPLNYIHPYAPEQVLEENRPLW